MLLKKRLMWLGGALALLAALAPGARPAAAQSAQVCFAQTGHCIGGRIREFWEQNGGLAVFGFPITPLQTESIEGRRLQVQWFERARLELHPQNPRPYDVQLGRLGARLLEVARAGAPVDMTTLGECRQFDATGRRVCGPILRAWRASGLEFDGRPGPSEAESLALFGLPISEPRVEQLADGGEYIVQWFERGRFELHPENAPPYDVLLGLLGRESGPVARAPEAPPPVQAAPPTRIVIDAIGLDWRVASVGVDGNGEPVVPDHDVGWFNQSAAPGAGDNVVLWGHVLRFRHAPQIPAPFARLKELAPGARITLYDGLGGARSYVVAQQVWARPNEVGYILPVGRERLTMVSCIGDQVIAGGEVVDMSHRLITIATPVS